MTRLVLDVKPHQLILSKDGSLRVAFFDRICKINVKCDDRGREISSEEIAKLYIHIEIPNDPSTVVDKLAGERKIVTGEDIRWVSETILFERAYNEYLKIKNTVVADPYAEIEELKKKLAAKEAVKSEDTAELEVAPKRGRKPAVKEEVAE